MTSQHVLERAIAKAVDGGWHRTSNGRSFYLIRIKMLSSSRVDALWSTAKDLEHNRPEDAKISAWMDVSSIIFNHDFVKALWGEFANDGSREDWYLACEGYADPEQGPYWKWQLQQMVIAEDPIKYLGENI